MKMKEKSTEKHKLDNIKHCMQHGKHSALCSVHFYNYENRSNLLSIVFGFVSFCFVFIFHSSTEAAVHWRFRWIYFIFILCVCFFQCHAINWKTINVHMFTWMESHISLCVWNDFVYDHKLSWVKSRVYSNRHQWHSSNKRTQYENNSHTRLYTKASLSRAFHLSLSHSLAYEKHQNSGKILLCGNWIQLLVFQHFTAFYF